MEHDHFEDAFPIEQRVFSMVIPLYHTALRFLVPTMHLGAARVEDWELEELPVGKVFDAGGLMVWWFDNVGQKLLATM